MSVFHRSIRITGIVCTTGIVLLLAVVLPSYSYFNGIVRTQAAHFTVPDFFPPEVTVSLQDTQGILLQSETVNEISDFQLTGQHSTQIQLSEATQVLSFDLTFTGNQLPYYQSDDCLRVFSGTQQLFVVRCEEITDTLTHRVYLPLHRLGVSSRVQFESQLADGVFATISQIQSNVWYLDTQNRLVVTVSDHHSVTVATEYGNFTWEEGQYVLDTSSLPAATQIDLDVVVTDLYQNTTVVTVPVIRIESPSSTGSVQSFAHGVDMHHSLVELAEDSAWYSQQYLFSESSLISSYTSLEAHWYPIRRYSEKVSILNKQPPTFAYNSFLQAYPLIETQ